MDKLWAAWRAGAFSLSSPSQQQQPKNDYHWPFKSDEVN